MFEPGNWNRKFFVLLCLLCFCLFVSILTAAPLNSGRGNEAKLASAIKAFKNANGKTDGAAVASMVDVFAASGSGSQEVVNLVALKLREDSPLYQGRGPKEVERLRGYILAALSKIGVNERVFAIVKGELSFGYHPYLVAAAARVAAVFELQEQRAALIPLLTQYLDETYKDDYVGLDTYGNVWPLKNPSSVRLEIIHALSKIGKADVETATRGLRQIAEAKSGTFFSSNHALVLKAKAAIESINGKLTETLLGSNVAVCSPGLTLSGPQNAFIAEAKRAKPLKNFKAVAQDGEPFELADIAGQPFIITFFYSRCDNPNKCSANVANFAALKQELRKLGLAEKVSMLAITYEPNFDNPSVIKSYGEGRGADFDKNFKFLAVDEKQYASLVKTMGVLVNYGKGMVNNHGSQLYIFSAGGQLARIYENTIWKPNDVVQDVRALLKERQGKQMAVKQQASR